MPTDHALSARTFGNEDLLPRVPLPTVRESCDRLLAWCAPLLTAEELAETTAAAEAFAAGAGPLQDALERYDASPGVDSWLDAFWDQRYLGRRDRIALNANFFFLFEDDGLGQVERAAALTAGALAYKLAIDEEALPPAVQRGTPLSMDQHHFLFSACRIPGDPQDTARTPYTDAWPGPSRERHVIVLHRGRAFRLDVVGPDGHPHALDELEDGLRAVVAAATADVRGVAGETAGDPGDAASGGTRDAGATAWAGARADRPGPSVGPLTTKARAAWAASRDRLLGLDPQNAATLDAVETALFCVCLEHEQPADPVAAGDGLLHGDSTNRWFDKSVSFVVYPDGTAGYNGEHCRLDGTTVIAMLDAVLDRTGAEHAEASGARSQGSPAVAPLTFVLDDALRADVDDARDAFAAYGAATATTAVVLDFDSERAKRLKVSPDAFAQMAFQLAHRRAKGHTGATYESIATRTFRHGRTEAMRVVTPEVVAFADAMEDPAASSATRRDALRAAAAAHVARARECQAGAAPEQHLWELQMLQGRRGAELGTTEPFALFESPGWRIMRDDFLSTSAVPSTNIRFWGFGSTSERCIGVAYALLPDRFRLFLSTPRTVAAEMETFAAELPAVVAELETLLAGEG
ncbi:choline/carnitine O-acyltransferase [Patulibacter minatonensis]|uniref:choline/carnitine O-acyltransferase n=1 Tax=Patulibacter minatonensis TaxID=298163 RepID=UPI000479F874|nr:choline/carnitine O-acyltransferase [Patulibacter minatonensis]